MPLPRLPCIAAVLALLSAPGPAAACGEPGRPAPPGPSVAAPAPVGSTPRPRPEVAFSDDDGPVVAGVPTREAAAAQPLFEAGRWDEAAPALERVASGETGDDDGNRQIARFRLGIALYHLGLYHGSLKVFGAVADHPDHYGYAQGLEWLAALDA